MNIFLDTNILYADPFFSSSFYELLLKCSVDKKIAILIPDICLNELYFKLTSKEKVLVNEIKQKVNELNRLTSIDYPELDIDFKFFEKKIKSFYEQKISDQIFCKLNHTSNAFEENLEKAIKGTPPFFTDKKEEFRDSLIWSIIRDYANNQPRTQNYFITANYRDFWNHDKTDIHTSLRQESSHIVIVDSVKKIFDLETSLVDYKKSHEFLKWLNNQKIDLYAIQKAINLYIWNRVVDLIDRKIKNFPINKFKPEHEMGFIVPELAKENLVLNKIEKVSAIDDFGVFEVSSSLKFQGKLHYPNYDKGDFSNFETLSLIAKIILTLSYDKEQLFKPVFTDLKDIELE